MKNNTTIISWIVWIVSSLILSLFLTQQLLSDDKSLFLPGQTSSGHYQIELTCETCHGDAFEGGETIQKACVKCHKAELKRVEDSHPKSKFTDPRNADRVAILDARYCVTCHVEHNPDRTLAMGVTMPEDYCFLCHSKIAKDRKSHAGMSFDSCDDAGCHNYHDNKALYEEFLVKHGNRPAQLPIQTNLKTNLEEYYEYTNEKFGDALSRLEINSPPSITFNSKLLRQWETTKHAASGVNCKHCHEKKLEWINSVGDERCKKCHEQEYETFLQSRHGMSHSKEFVKFDLKNSRVSLTKKAKVKEKVFSCTTCHSDHSFSRLHASINACLECHNDEHSLAYKKSRHYKLVLEENAKALPELSGVTCATCHLPRQELRKHGFKRIVVHHNQNDNLRPNEKMVRSVCMNCHGLQFSLESLADKKLINSNFQGVPSVTNEGFEMARKREELKRKGLIKDKKG